jgi:hypothetical protein
MSSSFQLEKIPEYIPPIQKPTIFLTWSNYKEILKSPRGFFFFYTPKLASLGALWIASPYLNLTIVSAIFCPIILIFMLLDKEIFKLLRITSAPINVAESFIIEAGWYLDPWSFGKVNQERYWDGEKWGTETRLGLKN